MARRIRKRIKSRVPEVLRAPLRPLYVAYKRLWHQADRRLGPSPWSRLRSTKPVCSHFGVWRGKVVDRYYLEGFLQRHQDDVRGHVLEIASPDYTRRFGGDRVTQSDVLHAVAGRETATMAGDLQTGLLVDGTPMPEGVYDCIILTETLCCIYDFRAAVDTVHRLLRPGGVVLATTGGIIQISRPDMEAWGEYWRFTSLSFRRVFEERFPADHVEVEAHGNVLAATALLHGIAADELTAKELDHHDPDYEIEICLRARKPLPSPAAHP